MINTNKLNLFPVKGGVSKHFSPRTIMSQRNLYFEKDCAHPYGAYMQVRNDTEPTNTNAPRMLDAIYLPLLDNIQGGHELMHLATGDLIRRRKVTKIPTSDRVIKAVESLAK